jgi:hypothetical protein
MAVKIHILGHGTRSLVKGRQRFQEHTASILNYSCTVNTTRVYLLVCQM